MLRKAMGKKIFALLEQLKPQFLKKAASISLAIDIEADKDRGRGLRMNVPRSGYF